MPVVFPSKDTDSIVSAFISDVHSRMPYICGSTIKFSNKPLIPFASLQPANTISQQPNARAAPVKPTLQKLLSTSLNSGHLSQVQTCSGQQTASVGSGQSHVAQVVPSLNSSAHAPPRAAPPVSSIGRIGATLIGQTILFYACY